MIWIRVGLDKTFEIFFSQNKRPLLPSGEDQVTSVSESPDHDGGHVSHVSTKCRVSRNVAIVRKGVGLGRSFILVL